GAEGSVVEGTPMVQPVDLLVGSGLREERGRWGAACRGYRHERGRSCVKSTGAHGSPEFVARRGRQQCLPPVGSRADTAVMALRMLTRRRSRRVTLREPMADHMQAPAGLSSKPQVCRTH